jgi:hypothetical protein
LNTSEVIAHIKNTRTTECMVDKKGKSSIFSYNEGVRAAWTPIWCRNAARSYVEVERRFELQDCDMRNLPRLNGEPVLVLGSGPSLDDVLPVLKEWKGKLVCSTSHLPLLKHMGIEPSYVFLIDADPAMEFLVKEFVKDNKTSIMITHPQVPREIIAAWPENRVYFFRMYDPGDKFSTDYLPLIFGWLNQTTNSHIGSYVLNSGNVINAIIPSMQALGAGAIFVCGMDLGYPYLPDKPGVPRQRSSYFGKSTTDYHDGEEDTLHEAPEMPSQEQRPIKYEGGNNGVLADELCFFYKYSFLILYGLAGVPVISCSRGIVSEVPYADPREVVAAQGKGFEHLIRPPHEAYEIARNYLRYRGLYIMKTDFWIETVNITTKKWPYNWTYIIRWFWYCSRPWKWIGKKGWKPLKIKLNERKQKRLADKAKSIADQQSKMSGIIKV